MKNGIRSVRPELVEGRFAKPMRFNRLSGNGTQTVFCFALLNNIRLIGKKRHSPDSRPHSVFGSGLLRNTHDNGFAFSAPL
jgi:hypothetical protein